MIRVLAIGGAPASGKSTLVRSIIKKLGPVKRKKTDLLVYEVYEQSKVIVLGYYTDEDTFGGTDKLSMAVQKDAERLLELWSDHDRREGWTVLFEGDRLFNSSFLTFIEGLRKNAKLYIYILQAREQMLTSRHKSRGDTQSETWLKGRHTKVDKILGKYGEQSNTYLRRHENVEDTKLIRKEILEIIGTT